MHVNEQTIVTLSTRNMVNDATPPAHFNQLQNTIPPIVSSLIIRLSVWVTILRFLKFGKCNK